MLCGGFNIIIAPKMKIPQSCTKHAQKCGVCLKKKPTLILRIFLAIPPQNQTYKTEYLVGHKRGPFTRERQTNG